MGIQSVDALGAHFQFTGKPKGLNREKLALKAGCESVRSACFWAKTRKKRCKNSSFFLHNRLIINILIKKSAKTTKNPLGD